MHEFNKYLALLIYASTNFIKIPLYKLNWTSMSINISNTHNIHNILTKISFNVIQRENKSISIYLGKIIYFIFRNSLTLNIAIIST